MTLTLLITILLSHTGYRGMPDLKTFFNLFWVQLAQRMGIKGDCFDIK